MTIGFAAPPGARVNVFGRFSHRWLLRGQKILLEGWASSGRKGLAAEISAAQFTHARGRHSGPGPMKEYGRRNREQVARSTVMDHVHEVAVTSISDRHECFATTSCALADVRRTALFCLLWADARASPRMRQQDTTRRASVQK